MGGNIIRKWLVRPVVMALCMWVLLVLWFFNPWLFPVRLAAVFVWSAGCYLVSRKMSARAGYSCLLVSVAAALFLQALKTPSNSRIWQPSQAHVLSAYFKDNEVRVVNLRHTVNVPGRGLEVHWYTRNFDLEALASVELVVVPFSGWRGLAHTMLVFGFDDGEHLAVSVESRREQGEFFSAVNGLFREYELVYMAGDERDFLGLRSAVDGHDIYLYPVRASREHVRALLVSMLKRASDLSEKPEFYNTFNNNCTTGIVRHMESLTGKGQSFDFRILFPGYADSFAADHGLIDAEAVGRAQRSRYRLPRDIPLNLDKRQWSALIRQGRP